ncbi:hypothetical protein H257_10747 [Aphanomyces astaci]|uniref:DUF7769 domain-containing protein n=1 Tax=Aphanomyces astaci TaxID=112090 RepID=W4G4M0_APHAT|nr:hypothetical protein H257_10747 [Aphanomyces astaci]ETV74610.1 hypothetical protein H257_10747 [Aphanomyces astaci]|eukprot:XP_009835697.1 hypothetical protein H257_10747 [Aphanomyces astaci]
MPSPRSPNVGTPRTGNKKLTDGQRQSIYETLLERSVDGELPHGCITQTARLYACTLKTISNVWARGRLSIRHGSSTADVSAKYKGNHNGKRVMSDDEIERAIRAVSLHERQTLRSLAARSGISKTTIIRHMECAKTLKLKFSHSKPYLTDANKINRMKHALAFLQPSSNETIFDSMNSYVHVDEKWFYLTTVKKCFYAYDDEELPKRQLKSKRYITKVMFLASVARPRYDPHKKGFFDGKIGIWPFVETVIAKRNSPNRPKGTPLIVPESVTADVYRRRIIEKVIPTIKAK